MIGCTVASSVLYLPRGQVLGSDGWRLVDYGNIVGYLLEGCCLRQTLCAVVGRY